MNCNGNHFDVVLETKSELQISNQFPHIRRCWNELKNVKNVINREINNFEQNIIAPINSNQVKTVNKAFNLEGRNRHKCFYSIARSIGNKFNEMKVINDLENFDIIGISKSWVNQKRHLISQYKLNGFKLFNHDRSLRNGSISKTHGDGGSHALHKGKDTINAVQIFTKENPNVECLWVKIKQIFKSLLLGIARRAPTQDAECDYLLSCQIEKAFSTNN